MIGAKLEEPIVMSAIWRCHECGTSQAQKDGETEPPLHECQMPEDRLSTLAAAMTGDWDPDDIFGIVTARDVMLLVREVQQRRATP